MRKALIGTGVLCLVILLLAIGEFGVFILTTPKSNINSIVTVEHLNITKAATENNKNLKEYVNESISGVDSKGEVTKIFFHEVD